jgi:hypothetical protein
MGNGAGDVVNGSALNVTMGNGDGDVVNTQGSSHNIVTFGNGAGDVFNDSFGSFNTVTFGNGNGNTVHVGFGDTVTVGKGHDTFVFDQTAPGSIGSVTINHFDPNHDAIQFRSALAAAVAPVDDSHGNAVIAVGGGTITLADESLLIALLRSSRAPRFDYTAALFFFLR